MKFSPPNPPPSGAFPMAPMMDVVFLLLCFFVTTQIFAQWEAEIDITLPTAEASDIQPRLPGEIIVNVMEDGEIRVHQRRLSLEQLGQLFTDIAEQFPGQPVLIRADQTTSFQHVIAVLDLCRQADIWNISFATRVPES